MLKHRAFFILAAVLCLSASTMAQPAAPESNSAAANDAKPAADKPAAAAPAFDAVDVHPSPHSRNQRFMQGGRLIGDRYFVRQANLVDLIANAYDLDASYIAGGPTWLEIDRFDIAAKAPPGTPPATLKLMLRAVLKDRFNLETHSGSAPMPAYVLRLANPQTKLKEPAEGSDTGCFIRGDPATPGGPISRVLMSCHNQTPEQVAKFLEESQVTGYVNKPVVDVTGVKDPFDLEIRFTFAGGLAMAGADGVSFFDALQNQAGLKLALETSPRNVMIVNSVDRTPTPNVAGIEKLLPPLPSPHFEVATVKPSKPDERGQGTVRGGQMDLHAISLKDLITFAWDLNPIDKEGVVNAPVWLEKDRFDFLAKVAGTDDGNGHVKPPDVDNEALRQLIQDLIEDRFRMKAHMEKRPVTAYTLVAAGPKLKPAADPNSRTKCTEGVGPDGKDPRQQFPTRNRLLWCQNMTMAQFAQELEYVANGFIYYPVKDDTGLKGGYDFAVNFTSIQLMNNQGSGGGGAASAGGSAGAGSGSGGGAGAGAGPSASDPNGAISLFDAIKSELGLKLEKVRRDEPVLVIDHIEEQPTEN